MNLKKTLFYTFGAALFGAQLCAPTAANAKVADMYAGASLGLSALHSGGENFITQSYGAMFGLDMPVFRAEVEYNYLSGNRKSMDINNNMAMLNGYAKLMKTPMIKPYVGAGVGMVFGGKVSGNGVSTDLNSRVAYQGMLGFQTNIPATDLYVDLEYRMAYANKIAPDADFWLNEIRVKLRYVF